MMSAGRPRRGRRSGRGRRAQVPGPDWLLDANGEISSEFNTRHDRRTTAAGATSWPWTGRTMSGSPSTPVSGFASGCW